LVGVYHFAHPENRPTTNGAILEADHFLAYAGSAIGPGRLRPALDMEEFATNLSGWALAFMQEVVNNRGAGAEPIIYCTSGYAGGVFDSRVANKTLWELYGTLDPGTISTVPTGVFSNWAFLQYNTGTAGGISPVDLDACHDDFAPLSTYLIPAPAPGFPIQSPTVNGSGFSLSFSNVPGTHFTLVSATNPATPLTNWTVVGTLTEVSPGQFQITDGGATNRPQRFYRVRSP
jgi:hypothetical protein